MGKRQKKGESEIIHHLDSTSANILVHDRAGRSCPELVPVISVRLEGLGLHSLGALLDGVAQRCGGGWQGLRPELAWGDSGKEALATQPGGGDRPFLVAS